MITDVKVFQLEIGESNNPGDRVKVNLPVRENGGKATFDDYATILKEIGMDEFLRVSSYTSGKGGSTYYRLQSIKDTTDKKSVEIFNKAKSAISAKYPKASIRVVGDTDFDGIDVAGIVREIFRKAKAIKEFDEDAYLANRAKRGDKTGTGGTRVQHNDATTSRKDPVFIEQELADKCDAYAESFDGILAIPMDKRGWPDRQFQIGVMVIGVVEYKAPGESPEDHQWDKIILLRDRANDKDHVQVFRTFEAFKVWFDRRLAKFSQVQIAV